MSSEVLYIVAIWATNGPCGCVLQRVRDVMLRLGGWRRPWMIGSFTAKQGGRGKGKEPCLLPKGGKTIPGQRTDDGDIHNTVEPLIKEAGTPMEVVVDPSQHPVAPVLIARSMGGKVGTPPVAVITIAEITMARDGVEEEMNGVKSLGRCASRLFATSWTSFPESASNPPPNQSIGRLAGRKKPPSYKQINK